MDSRLAAIGDELNQCLQIILTNAGLLSDMTNESEEAATIESAVARAAKAVHSLAHVESLESQLPNTCGVGLPPQRSMTPEESANLAAYHKTKFKRVAAQGEPDGLEDVLASLEKPRADSSPEHSAIFADAAYLVRAALPSHDAALIQKRDREWALVCAEHDIAALADSNGPIKLNSAALRASVREETLDVLIPAIIKWLSENPKWPIMSLLNSSLRKAATAALVSEKAAPEDSK